jgi:hypothetical protein
MLRITSAKIMLNLQARLYTMMADSYEHFIEKKNWMVCAI